MTEAYPAAPVTTAFLPWSLPISKLLMVWTLPLPLLELSRERSAILDAVDGNNTGSVYKGLGIPALGFR